MGANLKLVKAIKAIYNSVKVCVRAMEKVSDCFDSQVGVKHGEPKSPILFILFLNDLTEEFNLKSRFLVDLANMSGMKYFITKRHLNFLAPLYI